MKFSLIAVAVLTLLALPPSARGLLITFDDLPAGASYEPGERFTSNGVEAVVFNTIPNRPSRGVTQVTTTSPVGSGNAIEVFGDEAVGFFLPRDRDFFRGGFTFATFGGSTYLLINGDSGSIPLTGSVTRGGTTVTASNTRSVPGGTAADITISGGEINSLGIGGQEFNFDNVSLLVPEPTSLSLLAGTCLIMLRRRQPQS